MKSAAIVSEYNPFHNGHKYLIEKARANGATHIIAIMGGNFLQRGECAVMDKYARAAAAVKGGADLVLELPAVYATASAEGFARGAVEILEKSGCVDELCFGSEGGDIEKLRRAVDITQSDTVLDVCKSFIKQGYSHPRAMQAAAAEIGSSSDNLAKAAELLSLPNNTLGVEYIRALDGMSSSITPVAFERKSVDHNSELTCGEFASASKIRDLILNNDKSFYDYIPNATGKIIDEQIQKGFCPACVKNGDRAVLSVLRRMTSEQFAQLPDVTEGLENRIFNAVKESTSVEELILKVKCKRYTYARLSRIVICAFLGITKELLKLEPQYIRPLAFNDKGAQLLKAMKKASSLPIIMSLRKDKQKLSEKGKLLLEKDILASDLYRLLTPKIYPCSDDYYTGVVRVVMD